MAAHTGKQEAHIVPKWIYFAVFFALIILTWVTTGVSTIDLGRWNIFVALAIAIAMSVSAKFELWPKWEQVVGLARKSWSWVLVGSAR